MPYIEKNGNKFNLDNSSKANSSIIAPNYNSSAGVYDIGDYVIYNQNLYKCKTAISIPESFDSVKWDLVNIASILKYLELNIPGSGTNLPVGNLVSPNNILVGPFGVVTEVGGE